MDAQIVRSSARIPQPWQRRGDRPLVIGHRGASALFTENTMDAFAAARSAGADGVELDVMMCRDGEIMVFHDHDLARLAGRGERISTLTRAELLAVRLAGNTRIPTLAEVLADLSDVLINIEIKSPAPGRASRLTARVLELVAGAGAGTTDRLLISSFDPAVLAQVRLRAPHLAVGWLYHQGQPRLIRNAWLAPLLRPHALHPEHTLLSAARARALISRGYALNTWTVDAPAEIRRLAALGINALITNDPGATRRALGL